ncbi:PAS domain-containing protein [Halosquirtibacter xylanolyticus]|uniref:PAS domain-containing protein n=1 Tax=Halosquirtibacter xylanolyticus TaxID=3374599 RepID=UPI003747E770|nr:PAS domain-containing protein [Prolixibacteraceae bacterium]
MSYPDIVYIELDGRGENESFINCVLNTVNNLSEAEGIHIVKDFEPFPVYDIMQKRGYGKYTEQREHEEFHVWFYPLTNNKMKPYLNIDMEKVAKIHELKQRVFHHELNHQEAKELVNKTFDYITPEEFAYTEQNMIHFGISDEKMTNEMDDIIDIFKDVLQTTSTTLPKGHPIQTYINEAKALNDLVDSIEQKLTSKFIKNEWLICYEKLLQINIHFSRKQNQLFSTLETKGFDRPSKIMWTFDNNVRDIIKESYILLKEGKDQEFIKKQPDVIELVRDILQKEQDILFPTALKLINEDEFIKMRISDDEIGYCLISPPPSFGLPTPDINQAAPSEFMSDLVKILNKHGMSTTSEESNKEMDVSMGKLTLNQINLIFKHLPIDLSYVDENDIVKFYSDTKHRVFPRSAGVIGREVQNCHPRESVETVEEIIKAFRAGTQNQAEFWLQMGEKFIYIIYNAVRDEDGKFRGVLEMMQDATHIRSLQGSQKLLSWNNQPSTEEKPLTKDQQIHKDMIIAPLLKQHPFLKEYLISLSNKYQKLNNPVVFNTMGNIATLEMIASRGGFKTDVLIEKLQNKINETL